MTVEVSPDNAGRAGYALVRVVGAGGVADASFRIARPPGWPEPNLGPAGWQGAEASLQPDGVTREGADLVLSVGPAICGAIEEGTYIFTLVATGAAEPVAWPMIETVHGGTMPFFARAGSAAAGAELTGIGTGPSGGGSANPAGTGSGKELKDDEATITVDRVVTQPIDNKATSKLPIVGVGLLTLLALAAAGAWWWTHRAEPPPPPAEVATPPVQTPAPSPTPDPVPAPVPPPDFDGMAVADLVERNDPALMFDQAQKRMATKPQDSILLLEAAGEDRHFGPALTQLARLYDPAKPRQGGITADPRQAAKYYREADRNSDHDGRADREALRRTLQSRRDAGDLNAKLTEQDFWP